MRKKFVLTGGTIGTAATAIFAIYFISFGLVNIINYGYLYNAWIKFALVLPFLIVALVLNILVMTCWQKNEKELAKMKGVLITSVVFNFLLALFAFVDIILYFYSLSLLVLFLFFPCWIMAGVFVIIGFCGSDPETTRSENLQSQTTISAQPLSQNGSAPASQSATFEQKMQTLKRLADMRQSGLLTDEEYQKLKADILKDVD